MSCSVPIFHLYRTNTEVAHWEEILKKLNNNCNQKNIQTTNIKIRAIKFRLPFFCKTLSQNMAIVIIVQDISTVQYHNIEDQIIRQIHHQIKVVKAIHVNILSFLIMA